MIDNLRKYSALTLCSALLLGVPPVINGGHFFSFDQAQAAKGGNGNGKGGGGGGKSSNAGGQSAGKSSNAGGQSAGKSSKAGGKASATKTASVDKKDGGSIKSKKISG